MKNRMLKFVVFFSASLFCFIPSRAQDNGLTLEGVVSDTTGKGIDLAYVVINNSISALTDEEGKFVVKNLPVGQYDYYVSCLGYEEQRGKFQLQPGNIRLRITLKNLALALQEVTVTAQQTVLGSRSIIGQEAVRHIQPKSVADMLQLLPGSLTQNPTLNNLGQAHIREIDGDDNNALGTAVILDGMPLSNDGNMQALSPTRNGAVSSDNADGMSDQTTAGRGIDLRTVGADNIESIEVIRGIPSVEYGNLTSGVVVVKTKAGETPWELKFKADPFSKLVFAGKGFRLKKGGAVNWGLDWSQSYEDTRRHYLGYERVTISGAYSKIFNPEGRYPVSFNMRASFYSNVNNRKTDPQMTEMQLTFKNKNIGGRLAFNGQVQMNNWLTSLDYDVSLQVARTLDTHRDWVASPDGVVTDSRENGLALARLLTQAYFSDYRIEGIPINLYARLKANKYVQLSDNGYINLKAGVDYRLDGNRGDGLSFDMMYPPGSSSSQTLRPRSYKDIPILHNLSAFLEAGTTFELGGEWQWAAGVRVTNLFLDEEESGRGSIFVAEPRVNVAYTFLNSDNNRWFDRLTVNGGFGISNKMPTLLYLYPDNAYFDNVSLSQVGTGENSSMALMTTRVIEETQNPDLKPMHSRKWELGLNFAIGRVKGYVTYFNEQFRHEYGFSSQLVWLNYDRFNVPVGATNLEFSEGEVYYTYEGIRQTATKSPQVEMTTWSKPDNNASTDKHGVEYALDLGTFKPIRTSLNIDGAWFHIKRWNAKDYVSYMNRNYDYVPVRPAGNGTVTDRVNTNFRLITHIPAVRMIFTTTVQVVWSEKSRSIYQTESGEDMYHLSSDGTRYIVSPLGFYDREGNYTEWKPEYESNVEYSLMNGEYLLYAFNADQVKPWVLLNFRFTKEFGKIAELSFMANNFPNLSKWHVNSNTNGKRQLYPDMYFGAELKFKF